MASKLLRRDFLKLTAATPFARAAPAAVTIDGGRQLFFDDLVVAESTLVRTWHLPKIHDASPIRQVLRTATTFKSRERILNKAMRRSVLVAAFASNPV